MKNKETRMSSSVKNATKGCVPLHVLRYIIPNCISEDQLTLKWKSRTHECQ